MDNEGWPVVGSVTESSLRLQKRVRGRNSFQSILTARMRREPAGTVISAKMAMHPFVLAFMFFWFGVIILSVFFASGGPQKNAVPGGVMLAFGCALACFGRYLARNEARFITDFLIRTLDARELKST